MFVFLDAPQEPGQAGGRRAPRPTTRTSPASRPAARTWWPDDRPASLNVRQRINANWARACWSRSAGPSGSSTSTATRSRCARPGGARRGPAGRRRRLARRRGRRSASGPSRSGRPGSSGSSTTPTSTCCTCSGAIDEPTNQAYFHGHVMGKSGVRPASGLGLTLHEAVSADGQAPAARTRTRGCGVLHYDAASGEEFVRKWTALATAGPARYRAVARAVGPRAARPWSSSDLPDGRSGRSTCAGSTT